MKNRVPMIDGLRIDEAHKGGKGGSSGSSGPSAAQVTLENAQVKELAELTKKEDARVAAMGRKRRGRASLITGDETGLKQTLG